MGEAPMMERLISGDVLEGAEARKMLDEFDSQPWKLWVRIAVAYMEKGQYEQAQSILEGLLEKGVEDEG